MDFLIGLLFFYNELLKKYSIHYFSHSIFFYRTYDWGGGDHE